MSPSACGAGGAARLAVQSHLHVAGEAMCDEGRFEEGIKLIRRALDAQPELDAEEWPAWRASKLRLGLEHAAMHRPPYSYAVADVDLDGGDMTGRASG